MNMGNSYFTISQFYDWTIYDWTIISYSLRSRERKEMKEDRILDGGKYRMRVDLFRSSLKYDNSDIYILSLCEKTLPLQRCKDRE